MGTKQEMKELLWDISTNGDIPRWDEVWEEVTEDDEEIVFQTVKTYKHEDDCEFGDFTFEYKYVMRIGVVYDYDGYNDGKVIFYADLYLVPLASCIHEEIVEKWKSSFTEWDINEVDMSFIVQEEMCPLIKHESCEMSNDTELTTWHTKDLYEFLSKAGACIPIINSTKTFELDRAENMLGTTGWELLKGLIYNVDPFKLTIKRLG